MIKKWKNKKLSRECWNIDYSFIKWLNEHLKIYLEDAGKVVDLTFREYEYGGVTYTLEDVIKRMIYLSDELKNEYYAVNKSYEYTDELLDLFRLVFYDLWW